MPQGYLIGETLLGQIKDTVKRVQGEPMIGAMTRIETRFESLPTQGVSPFRICTFTGAWAIDSEKEVTFRGVTTTPNTVSAMNLFLPLPDGGTATRNCAIGKDGTAWYLLQAQWDAADVLSGVTLGTAALEFTRVSGVSLGTATTVQISITTCATATGS